MGDRPWPSRIRIAATAALLLLAAAPGRAAAVEILVRERAGPPQAGVDVRLEAGGGDRGPGRIVVIGTTGGAGRATFEGLEAGSYRIVARPPRGSDLVAPDDNPFAPPSTITLLEPDGRVELTVELWRGAPVVAELRVDRGELPRPGVTFLSPETGFVIPARPGPDGRVERVLAPGRWRVAIDPPPGRLLVDLEIDGISHPGHEAVLDLQELSPATFVTWHYVAPATIWGRVSKRGDGPVRVVATLVEPGPWAENVRRRGGSAIDQVPAHFITPTEYEMHVPDGTWTVRPESDALVASTPPEITLDLEPGEAAEADFDVELQHGGDAPLLVRIAGPDGVEIGQARIEVWRAGDDGHPLERLAQRGVERAGLPEAFHRLPAGPLLVVAGHRDLLEGRRLVADHDPDGDQPTRVVVALQGGASVLAVARDEEGRVVADVELRVQRMDELPPLVLDDPEFRAAKSDRREPTDLTGAARIGGLYPGVHEISARLRGALAATRFVRVRGEGGDDDGQPERVSVSLASDDALRVDLQVLPAASIAGTLACAGGGPLPGATSVRLFPMGVRADPEADPELTDGAVLARDGLTLGGRHRDRFLVGPLAEDALHVAVRPAGHDAWTWALGAADQDDAVTIQTSVGATEELGAIRLDCRPAMVLVPLTPGDAPPVDLGRAKVHAVARALGAPEREVWEPQPETRADRIVLRGLPVGEPVRVEVRLEHPWLLPAAVRTWTFEQPLARGAMARVEPPLGAIGGAVDVRGEGAAARLTGFAGAGDGAEGAGDDAGGDGGAGGGGDETSRLQAVDGRRAWFPAVAPGRYRVELCDDPACREVRRRWDDVQVAAGETRLVRDGGDSGN